MGAYENAAEYYDLLYAGDKDYAGEAELVSDVIRTRCPNAASILDVGCGTGNHARALVDLGFDVDGLDLESDFIDIASGKCPESTFHLADMRTFDLPDRYDAVVSLFSAIGYVKDEEGLNAAIARMAHHLKPGGVLIVDPWFEPGDLTDLWITTTVGEADGVSACRMSRTVIEGSTSRLEFEYLIGAPSGLERRSETHTLGLFTQTQTEAAFHAAGLSVERVEKALRTRGMYVGVAR